jgi:D-methionine transport system substrate-binding protein
MSISWRSAVSGIAVATVAALTLGACGGESGDSAAAGGDSGGDKTITIGFFPGPYADMFNGGVKPVLEKNGYTVKTTEFTNAIQPNTATMNGDVDATVFQNIPFMEQYNANNSGSVVRVEDVPTLKSAFFSKKHKSLDELADGMKVSIPNDPTNLSLGLEMLQKAGYLTLKPGTAAGKATEKDVASKKSNYELVLIDAPQAPRSLDDVDFGLVLGSWIYASKLPKEQMVLEEGDLTANGWIIISAKDSSKDKQNIKDLVAAYQSDEFKKFVEGDPRFAGLAKPSWW